MKNKVIKVIKVIYIIVGILYMPIYTLGILLHFASRFLLAISYFILMEKRMAIDIVKSLFKLHGRS